MVVAVHEGIIKEAKDCDEKDPENTVFGRSLYCNLDQSFFLGYTNGLERQGKGIYMKKGNIFQQGFFTAGRLDSDNSYSIVDLMHNVNDKQTEQELNQKLQEKQQREQQKKDAFSYLSYEIDEHQKDDSIVITLSDEFNEGMDSPEIELKKERPKRKGSGEIM